MTASHLLYTLGGLFLAHAAVFAAILKWGE